MPFTKIPECSSDLIMELVHALERSEFIVEACALGVYDVIKKLGRPCTVQDIAGEVVEQRNQSTEMKLNSLLHTSVAFGLLTRTEAADGKVFFDNTDISRTYLVKGEFSMLNLVKAARHKFEVAHMIKTGEYEENRSWFYSPEAQEEALVKMPHRFRKFYLKQEGYAMSAIHLFKAFDLSKYRTAMDLGGGTGVHAKALKSHYPGMKVTSLDLPRVTEFAHNMNKERNITKIDFEYASVDVFKQDLPKADLYCVAHLLHMFSEQVSESILKKVYAAVNPGGAILVLEKTICPNRSSPELVTMYNCRMSLGMERGFERTVKEYKDAFEKTGFCDVRYHENKGYNCYDAFLATKK